MFSLRWKKSFFAISQIFTKSKTDRILKGRRKTPFFVAPETAEKILLLFL